MDLILTKDIWKLLPFVPKSISPFQILIRAITLILPLAPRLRMSWDSASPSSTARWPYWHQIVTIVKKIIFIKASRSVSLNWNKAEMIEMEKLNFPTAGWDHQASDGGSFPKPNKPPSPSSSCRRSSGQIYLDADVCGKIKIVRLLWEKKYFEKIIQVQYYAQAHLVMQELNREMARWRM